MFNGLGLVIHFAVTLTAEKFKSSSKEELLIRETVTADPTSAVMHKTDESEWNKSKKGHRVVSWKSSLVGHQNLAAFRMLCIFRGKKQK